MDSRFLVVVAARVPEPGCLSYIMLFILCHICCAIHTMQSMLCYLSSAIYAIYAVLSSPYYLRCVSLLRGRCYAIFPMLSLLCYLCSAMLQSKLTRTAGPWPTARPMPVAAQKPHGVARGVSGLSATEQEARTAIRIAKFNIWRAKCLKKEYMAGKKELIRALERRLLDSYRQGSLQQRLVEVKSQYQGDPMHRSPLRP